MSENILKYTTDKALRNITSGIITEQTKSIADMCQIKSCCSRLSDSGCDLQAYQCRIDQIMENMFSGMSSACATGRVNCDFIREMIPHHEGAVRMSETTLQFCICPELVPILTAIISSQEKGILQMENLMNRLGC